MTIEATLKDEWLKVASLIHGQFLPEIGNRWAEARMMQYTPLLHKYKDHHKDYHNVLHLKPMALQEMTILRIRGMDNGVRGVDTRNCMGISAQVNPWEMQTTIGIGGDDFFSRNENDHIPRGATTG